MIAGQFAAGVASLATPKLRQGRLDWATRKSFASLPMKKLLLPLALALAAWLPLAVAQTPAPASQRVDASAAIPKTGNARFFELHEKFLARAKSGPIGVLFLGDSITEGWGKAPQVWDYYYGKMDPANFGIGGDQTQHVIWRIENGELDGLITEAAIADAGKRMAVIDRANTLLAKLDDGVNVRFLDIGDKFLGRDGKIPWTIMPDQLHPTAAGYQLWAEAMQPLLKQMLK